MPEKLKTMIQGQWQIRRQRDDELYSSLASKLYSMLMQGAITTCKDDNSMVDDIVQESVSPSRWRCRRKLWWVCLRARDHRIRRGKSSFEGWGKLTLLLIGQFPCWWLEKDVSCPWEKLLAGSVVRGRIDFSYLPIVEAQAICLFERLCIIET